MSIVETGSDQTTGRATTSSSRVPTQQPEGHLPNNPLHNQQGKKGTDPTNCFSRYHPQLSRVEKLDDKVPEVRIRSTRFDGNLSQPIGSF